MDTVKQPPKSAISYQYNMDKLSLFIVYLFMLTNVTVLYLFCYQCLINGDLDKIG